MNLGAPRARRVIAHDASPGGRGLAYTVVAEEQVQPVVPEPQRIIDAEAEAGTFMDDSDVDDDF